MVPDALQSLDEAARLQPHVYGVHGQGRAAAGAASSMSAARAVTASPLRSLTATTTAAASSSSATLSATSAAAAAAAYATSPTSMYVRGGEEDSDASSAAASSSSATAALPHPAAAVVNDTANRFAVASLRYRLGIGAAALGQHGLAVQCLEAVLAGPAPPGTTRDSIQAQLANVHDAAGHVRRHCVSHHAHLCWSLLTIVPSPHTHTFTAASCLAAVC